MSLDPSTDDTAAAEAATRNGKAPAKHPPRRGAMDPYMEEVFTAEPTPFVERLPALSPFPPIADYGFLSDCHTAALVAPDGTVEWLCPPRFDAPSVFAAILDRSAGGFRLGPSSMGVPAGRRYEPGTNILETTWMTPTGWLVVRDALIIGRWRERTAGSPTAHTRPPTDYESYHCLVRTITCVHGQAQIEALCEPMFDYGRVPAEWSRVEGDPLAVDAIGVNGERLRLISDLRVGIEGSVARARHRLETGETRFCVLSWSRLLDGPRSVREAEDALQTTSEYWRGWLADGKFPDHRWRGHLQRSALVLKGLTYAPTGAMVAAPTTSLPETPGGERNWDYRFTWMRDATFTLSALNSLGLEWEADDFIQFVADAERNDDGSLQIMYGIGGERSLEEQTLDHLTGYENASPVRVGNGAHDQRQNDVYGAVLDSIYLHTKEYGHNSQRLWPVIEDQVKRAIETWRLPDQGIWEARGEPQHYTSSKLMCWVALDRGARLAARRGKTALADRWREVANEVHAEICEKGVDGRGVFTQHYDTDALDASLLLIPLVRFLPHDDPRVVRTVLAIADELSENDLVLRYRTDETDDGLSGEEGTFLICSFWLVNALLEIGERKRGRQLCERLLSLGSSLELYAEELDAATGRHLGNFPQAFTHLALINAVMHVIRDEEYAPLA
ncbi:MAG: alpha,alpha-trehalase [Solirubrobacteraceae bacterium]|jgi:GH15 family glucan-1,4-alpha-glucosidase|nr:alpha,alpha-trehalase [Solirubrobacteraceae bacterium]